MDILALLKSFIYLVSASLLLPVLLVLSLLTIWLVVYSGTFSGMWLRRRRLARNSANHENVPGCDPAACSPAVQHFRQKLLSIPNKQQEEIAVLHLLRASEHHMWKTLDKLKVLIRIGPGLGLIGTLIPMGTGLAALGEGDLTRLSGDLVIAFTTTVVGMALGLASYCFFTVQRRWVEEDVRQMELLCELEMYRAISADD
jgi:biopolymer transport protein ExbB/TolQ